MLPQGHKAQLPIPPSGQSLHLQKVPEHPLYGFWRSTNNQAIKTCMICVLNAKSFAISSGISFTSANPHGQVREAACASLNCKAYLETNNDLCVKAEFISQIALGVAAPAKQLRKALLALGSPGESLIVSDNTQKSVREQVIVLLRMKPTGASTFFKQGQNRETSHESHCAL